jgi:hypothetical protein
MPIPSPSSNVNSPEWYRFFLDLDRRVRRLQSGSLTTFIATAANQDYTILVNAPYAVTIDAITTVCSSGTCTLTGKINTTPLGGTANSVSSTEETQTHTSDNVVSVGDDVVLTISSNSAAVNVAVTVAYTARLT